MDLSSLRFRDLMRSDPASWTLATLAPCTRDELGGLCRLLGIAHSGTREQVAARLVVLGGIRAELGGWGEYEGDSARAHALAAGIAPRYTKARLLEMSRACGLFLSTSKLGHVLGLLQWRDCCRQEGQAFLGELRQARTIQRVLPL